MNFLAYAFLLCFLSVRSLLGTHYEIVNITANPGLYYERVQSVKIRKGGWKVIVYVDVPAFLKTHGPTQQYDGHLRRCTERFDHQKCYLFLNTDAMELKLRTLNGIHEEIRITADNMDVREPEPPSSPEGMRSRRMAPLGVIGSLSKSLFGLITEDDAELINKNIDKLFHDQADLVKLSDEKTHLMAAGLEELYNITASHRLILKNMEGQLKDKLNAMTHETNENHLLWEFNIFGRQAETKIDHLIYSNRELLSILNYLMDRKLHPRLLQKETLHRIAADIRQHETNLELPIPLHHLRAEELVKIAVIDATYHKGKILVSLTLPLTDRMSYDLYKLHPLAIPQSLRNHTYGSAYIIPRFTHLALSKDQQNYLPLDQNQLNRCLDTHYGHICSTRGVMLSTQGKCEIEMLLRPSRTALDSCNIAISKDLSTQWSYLEVDGTWIFSAATEERIRISCPDDVYENAKLRGVGILRLAHGCMARTPSATLISEDIRTSSVQYLYEPETNLNVTDIYPIFKENVTLEYLPDKGDTGPLSSWTAHKLSLKTVLDKMDEIGQHDRDSGNTRRLTYGGFAVQTLIVLGLIIFFGFKCRNCQNRTPNVTHSTIISTPSPTGSIPSPPLAPMSASRTTIVPIQTAETD